MEHSGLVIPPEDKNIKEKPVCFVLDYREIRKILKEEPSKFEEVNSLEELKKLRGDCVYLVTPDVTLISRKYNNRRKFVSVKRDLEQCKTADK